MSRRRILLVGYGRIGREVFADLRELLAWDHLMVVDPAVAVPAGFEWDRGRVDIAMLMVDTPAVDRHRSSQPAAFDYRGLTAALDEYLRFADSIVVRSTVSLDFLDLDVYVRHVDCIGFSPEFYGATRHSRRGQVDLGFVIVSDSVPAWFAGLLATGVKLLRAPAREVIVAKLAENAYLATKVTFFHELALTCSAEGISFETVRELVTSDPRITPYHSFVDDGVGWSSHCFDKDVPVFAELGHGAELVEAVLQVNRRHLEKATQERGIQAPLKADSAPS